MIKIDEDYIKSLPLVTNKIRLDWDRELFFAKYSIVSYYSTDKTHNLAYEQLADPDFISVTGIRARWNESSSVKFFVLCTKGTENTILKSLRDYEDISSCVDTLVGYSEKAVIRIVASLAINSLGRRKSNTMMYNDGSLLICDDKNFGIKPSRKELVALKIEVNEYLILTARTTSFSNPRTEKDLLKYRNNVLMISKDIDGVLWSGQSIKPVVIRTPLQKNVDLSDYYIRKKRFPNNKNLVPYWPYDKNDYTHGRLFALTQVVELVNECFSPILHLDFSEAAVEYYDACKTGEDMLSFISEGLGGRSIFIDDPFKTNGSKAFVSSLKNQLIGLCDVRFNTKEHADDMVIKLCEPDSDDANIYYEQSLTRLGRAGTLQHLIYDPNSKKNEVNKSTARRILIELLVKDSLSREQMPSELAELISGWQFIRYKVKDGFAHGASLQTDGNNGLIINDFGLSESSPGEEYGSFCQEYLSFDDWKLIAGARDYLAMVKDGNSYIIIDTDEIPILDARLIDDGYDKIVNKGETLSLFKRKAESHKYLRGYIGLHLWRTEGLYGEENGAYSYIAGTNNENIKIFQNSKMDKMPRARRIFTLHKRYPERVNDYIMGIVNMLKYGFGRWNELMTYPFPFKFLYEYLDNACEISFCKHWREF